MTELVEFAGRDGNRLAADAIGDPADPSVVLLHGGGQTRHSWGTTLESLAAHGWRAYSVDLRGHGDSEWAADGDYTLDAFAGDVVAICRALGDAPALVGASLGGLASLAAIGEHPDDAIARALVLVDVAPRIGGARSQSDRRVHDGEHGRRLRDRSTRSPMRSSATTRTARGRRTSKGSRRTCASAPMVGGTGTGIPRSSAAGSAAPTRRASSLTDPARLQMAARALRVPTLLVRGRVSDLLSEEGARELLELVPHAKMVDVAEAGHMVAGDRNDLFNDAVVSFLDDVKDQGA